MTNTTISDKNLNVMTPEEFKKAMEDWAKSGDIERRHFAMDELMCEVLSSLGYREGIKIYNDTEAWYS